jgi:membrane associated rhomboid family serine protease
VTPHVNRLLLAINSLVFAVYVLSSQGIFFQSSLAGYFETHFIMVPNDILHGQMLYTLLTSMFMHATLLHLLGNMLFLYVFGDNVEAVFGHVSYLVFYLAAGLAAALAFIAALVYAPAISSIFGVTVPSDLTVSVLGASGAISGVLGAYLVLFPKARILTFFFFVIIPLPAILFLGFWFVLQWLLGFYDVASGVAYFAHIGGFIAGMILALVFGLKRKKALRTRLHPKAM